MSKLDDLKNKAKDLVTENRDRIEDGLEKAGDMINQHTGGKHEDKIASGLDKAKEGLDRAEGRQNEEVPGPAGTEPMPGDHPNAPQGPLMG
jgi:hypothetical protein